MDLTQEILSKHKFFSLVVICACTFLFAPAVFAADREVHVIQLNDDTINPVTSDYIVGAIARAENSNAACLIIELDTPGGLLTSTRSIVKAIMASKVPVVVYIAPSGSRAGSAGVFITYASHVAAMAPSTNIGAAHPVNLGGRKQESQRSVWDALRDTLDSEREKKKSSGKGSQYLASPIRAEKEKKQVSPKVAASQDEDPMSSKILNDTTAFIKAMAKERGRNIEWAQSSVTESLSITEREALDKKVVELIAQNEQDLLTQLDGRVVKINNQDVTLQTKGAIVKHFPMELRRKLLNILANPNVAYIFFILGFYGLLFEVTHPGAAVPGVLGTIFLILAFFSMQLLPTNYAGLALIMLAIILFIAEIKFPGFGLLTLGGLVCMILGSMMLFDSAVPIMRVSMSLVLTLTLTTALITTFLVRLVFLSHKKKVVSGKEGMIGEKGHAYTNLLPREEGKVFVHGEIWNALANDSIKKDEKVVVTRVDGITLHVRKGD